MSSPFFRLHTDGTRQSIDWRGAWSGPTRTACWLIGGGPSLNHLPTDRIAAAPLPRLAINLAGHRHFRPTLWTSYDPTCRFHRSIYLDPSIIKFVHTARGMDLVPGTSFKVCESPSLYFFERDRQRGFAGFLSPTTKRQPQIPDWQDSFIQAIAIAYHLGFRVLYLAGCDMFIRPSPEQTERAQRAGVEYRSREPLKEFFSRCRKAGVSNDEMASLAAPAQYHFDEVKPLPAAIQTDWHYFRVAQYLRLCRRSMALAGLELISVTPDSRLNDFFEFRAIDDVLSTIHRDVGHPEQETTRGQYSSTRGEPSGLRMKDFPPHHWNSRGPLAKDPEKVESRVESTTPGNKLRLRSALAELSDVEIPINEIG